MYWNQKESEGEDCYGEVYGSYGGGWALVARPCDLSVYRARRMCQPDSATSAGQLR